VGAANGTVQQGRYAAAEMVPAAHRGQVVGFLLTGSVFGALLTSLLSKLVEGVAAQAGLPAIELGWYLGGLLLAAGALLIGLGLRPDPSQLALTLAPATGSAFDNSADQHERPWSALLQLPGLRLAMFAMMSGQAVMVMLMVLMPLHAKHLGHNLSTISLLLTGHIAGMFGLAWLTGHLTDRFGRRLVIVLGAVLLVIASGIAIFAEAVLTMGISLFLLGLGWNLAYVGGSTLLADQLRPTERANVQGSADLGVWLSAAAGALGGGVLVGTQGFPAVGIAGLVVSLLLLLAPLALGRTAPTAPAANTP
jgi:predicted MFS family arabinose efflux permease